LEETPTPLSDPSMVDPSEPPKTEDVPKKNVNELVEPSLLPSEQPPPPDAG
jgi:hypothetical protein